MQEIDFISKIHKNTKRDYLARVNDKDFPKHIAAKLAKQWGYDYWDGDRRINYGGYKFIPGRWKPVAENLINHYKLNQKSRILDIGCGKGFQIKEIKELLPNAEIVGLDVSEYALQNAHPDIKDCLVLGSAESLPFESNYFDLVISINTLHNLYNYQLHDALKEIQRVGKQKYLCVESYRTEKEKTNLLYWQVTCESFYTPEEWIWWFNKTGYNGDYSFIYFD